MKRHQFRLDIGPELLFGLTERYRPSGVGCAFMGQRMMRFPRDRCTEIRIERKKLEGFDYAYTALLEENPQPVRKRRPAPKRRR